VANKLYVQVQVPESERGVFNLPANSSGMYPFYEIFWKIPQDKKWWEFWKKGYVLEETPICKIEVKDSE